MAWPFQAQPPPLALMSSAWLCSSSLKAGPYTKGSNHHARHVCPTPGLLRSQGSGSVPGHLSSGAAVNCCADEQGLSLKQKMHTNADTALHHCLPSPYSQHSI